MELAEAKRLGDHLIEHDIVPEPAIHAALEEHKITDERLGTILVRNGFISQPKLIEIIRGLDTAQLSSEQALVTAVPAEVLVETRTMILAETADEIFIATFSDESYVRAILERYYPRETLTFQSVNVDILDEYLERVEMIDDESDVLLDRLIRDALRRGVTDMHIHPPRAESYSVFTRHLGVLQHAHEGDIEEYDRIVAQIKDRAAVDLAERRVPQDGAFQIEFNGSLIDMRVATLPGINGEKIVIRLLDPNRVEPKLDDLGISRLNHWRAGVSESQGLCLICGPTGSGKTTTLQSTVREMDRFGQSINTLEDPVEYRIPYVMQMNINHAVGLDFSRGLRAYMRGDPDVIIVGEIRDLETAQYALKAAETGHLVIGTLHTGSIEGSIQRLRDLGVDRAELEYLLRAVLVQRLVRTLCPDCQGKGCQRCLNSGYASRSVVSEAQYFPSEKAVAAVGRSERWWPTMLDDAVEKIAAGITDVNEITRVFGEPAKRALKDRGYEGIELLDLGEDHHA